MSYSLNIVNNSFLIRSKQNHMHGCICVMKPSLITLRAYELNFILKVRNICIIENINIQKHTPINKKMSLL